ncbi:methionyl-tRNA formyltransferase [Kocuria sp. cx-116]|uniref:methionyl-tRNA formyltransferase n=1 Tax=Kocuria sp. cx-116 TaxID=2771378 RepID=UPI002A4E2978|nr:methionyl-tRNA formyltransferase [Kocuria sp. cx-116]
MRQPLKVLYAGTPATAVIPLDALLERDDLDVVAVLTREDAPVGRKKVLTPSPVAQRAEERGIPTLKANRATAELVEQLRATGADIAAVVAYGALLPRPVLDVFEHGWVNLHFSLLPQWRGAAPVQRALMAGDTMLGATTFVLDEGMDTGDIVGTLTDPLRTDDTAGSVLERLSHSGASLLADSLVAVATGQAKPVPQEGEASKAPKLTGAQARIEWNHPAVAVSHHVRGVTPEPGAWTNYNGQRMKIDRVIPTPRVAGLAAGHVEVRDGAVYAGTGSYAVELTRVQPSGKKPMAALDWARGQQRSEQVVFE